MRGFSFIEIMVTLAIIGFLVGVGYPNYLQYKRESRRSEAYSDLIKIHSQIQRYLVENNLININTSDIGTSGTNIIIPAQTTNDNYTLSVDASLSNYVITATAVASGPQAKDTNCYKIILDYKNTKTSAKLDDTSTTGCW